MSDYSRNNIPEESIEETRRKKMEEFRRSADRSAIRGEYDYSGDTPSADYTSYEKHSAEESSQRRRRRNREIRAKEARTMPIVREKE